MSSYKINVNNVIYFKFIVAQSKHSYSNRKNRDIRTVSSKQNPNPAGWIPPNPEVLCPTSGASPVMPWAAHIASLTALVRLHSIHTRSSLWQTSRGLGISSILGSPLPPSLHLHIFVQWPLQVFLLGLQFIQLTALRDPSSLFCLLRVLCHIDNT